MARVRGVGLQASMLGALFFAGVQLACGDQFFQPAGALRGAQISAPALVPLADVPVYYDVPLAEARPQNVGSSGGFPYAFCFAVCALATAAQRRFFDPGGQGSGVGGALVT